LVIDPAMEPSLPSFRAVLWVVFASYWSVRIFGALLPLPSRIERWILLAVTGACAAALIRSSFAVLAQERTPYWVPIVFGGFSLFAIPISMVRSQLRDGYIPYALDGQAASLVALTIAGVLGTNLLLSSDASGFRRAHAAEIEAAAKERGVSPAALAALVASGQTPLGSLCKRIAMNEWLSDDKSHFVIAPAFADVRIGPLQLSPRETMLAIRRTGAPWTKQYREIGYDVPRLLTGEMPPLSKEEVVRRLFDDKESLRLAALVLASRVYDH